MSCSDHILPLPPILAIAFIWLLMTLDFAAQAADYEAF